MYKAIKGDLIMDIKRKAFSVFIVVVMLMFSNLTVFATERIDYKNDLNLSQEIVVQSADRLVAEFHSANPITKNTTVGYVQIGEACDKVIWRIGTSSGLVILDFTNVSTGEVRPITAVANNQEDSLTWVSPLPAGKWKISVNKMNKNIIIGGVNLYFYT